MFTQIFNQIKIGPRLAVLLVVLILLLLGLGLQGLYALNQSSKATQAVSTEVSRVLASNNLLSEVQGGLEGVANSTNNGELTWADARGQLSQFVEHFDTQWATRLAQLSQTPEARKRLSEGRDSLDIAVNELQRLFEAEDRSSLSLFVLNDLSYLLSPVVSALTDEAKTAEQASVKVLSTSESDIAFSLRWAIVLLLVGIMIVVGLGFLVTRSITRPVQKITDTVKAVTEGDYSARTGVQTSDEIGALGKAFDGLLNERVASLAEAEEGSEQLNESVIGLLMGVSRLSRKDLTTRLAVTEDATGPVADALNQMAKETASVMIEVRTVAKQVDEATEAVDAQANMVANTAERQREEVAKTTEDLAVASDKIRQTAVAVERATEAASRTTETTESAAATVQSTLQEMDTIRDTIQDAGKRIKRLGERSQEISGIVDVINGIAERTSVLALNASMQAASAGEAGRGFSVVADEVQRLAESSRSATEQIALLVKNIVVETNDTMSTMDTAIGKVVEGSRQAQTAGEQMFRTVDTTAELTEAVKLIAEGSQAQSEIAEGLLTRAEAIREETTKTSGALAEQLLQTGLLRQYAGQLVGTVGVFTLPDAKADDLVEAGNPAAA